MGEQLISERDIEDVEVVDPHLLVLSLGSVDEPAGHQGVAARRERSLGESWREEEEEGGDKSEHRHSEGETDSQETITGIFIAVLVGSESSYQSYNIYREVISNKNFGLISVLYFYQPNTN